MMSDEIAIADTVFQGTVLGPPLWNTFFNDVSREAIYCGTEPAMFADDLNLFKKFDRTSDNDEIKLTMEDCRRQVHFWGRRNRVTFDAGKEHIVVIHLLQGEGEIFRLLGCMVDVKLLMDDAIGRIL